MKQKRTKKINRYKKINLKVVFLVAILTFTFIIAALSVTGNLIDSRDGTMVSIAGVSRGVVLDECPYNYAVNFDYPKKDDSELSATLGVKVSKEKSNNRLVNPFYNTIEGVREGDVVYFCAKFDAYENEDWIGTKDFYECGNSDKDIKVEILKLWRDPLNGVYRMKYRVFRLDN